MPNRVNTVEKYAGLILSITAQAAYRTTSNLEELLFNVVGLHPEGIWRDINRFKHAKTYWLHDVGEACKEAHKILIDTIHKTKNPFKIIEGAFRSCARILQGLNDFSNRFKYISGVISVVINVALTCVVWIYAPLYSAYIFGGLATSRWWLLNKKEKNDKEDKHKFNYSDKEQEFVNNLAEKYKLKQMFNDLCKEDLKLTVDRGLSIAQILLNLQNKMDKLNLSPEEMNKLRVSGLDLQALGLKDEQLKKLAQTDINPREFKEFLNLIKEFGQKQKDYSHHNALSDFQKSIKIDITTLENKAIAQQEVPKIIKQYQKTFANIDNNTFESRLNASIKAHRELQNNLKTLKARIPFTVTENISDIHKERQAISSKTHKLEQDLLVTPLFSTISKILNHPIGKALGLDHSNKSKEIQCKASAFDPDTLQEMQIQKEKEKAKEAKISHLKRLIDERETIAKAQNMGLLLPKDIDRQR